MVSPDAQLAAQAQDSLDAVFMRTTSTKITPRKTPAPTPSRAEAEQARIRARQERQEISMQRARDAYALRMEVASYRDTRASRTFHRAMATAGFLAGTAVLVVLPVAKVLGLGKPTGALAAGMFGISVSEAHTAHKRSVAMEQKRPIIAHQAKRVARTTGAATLAHQQEIAAVNQATIAAATTTNLERSPTPRYPG